MVVTKAVTSARRVLDDLLPCASPGTMSEYSFTTIPPERFYSSITPPTCHTWQLPLPVPPEPQVPGNDGLDAGHANPPAVPVNYSGQSDFQAVQGFIPASSHRPEDDLGGIGSAGT